MPNRMPAPSTSGHTRCCFQMTAAERRRWVAAGETLGSGLIAVARGLATLQRRAISLSRAPDNGDWDRPGPAAEVQAEGASRCTS